MAPSILADCGFQNSCGISGQLIYSSTRTLKLKTFLETVAKIDWPAPLQLRQMLRSII